MDDNGKVVKNLKQLEVEYKYGVKIRMEGGQRIIGYPSHAMGYENERKGTEIYICNIPRNIFEDVLFPLFSTVGRIRQMRIMMEFSGINRGFGFVKYYDTKSVKNAISQLDRLDVSGNIIRVRKSVDNCKLKLEGLPYDISMKYLTQEIENVFTGVVGINKNGNFQSKYSCVIVTFETHRHALEARKLFWPDKLVISNSRILVEWANPYIRGN